MGLRVLLLRHGESYSNLPNGDNKWDSTLTEAGKDKCYEFKEAHREAVKVDQRLDPKFIFVSNLHRAIQTASIAFQSEIANLQWANEAEGRPGKATVIPYFQEGSDWMSDVGTPLQDIQRLSGGDMYFGSPLVFDHHWKTCTLKYDKGNFFGPWNIRKRAVFTLYWLRNWYLTYHPYEDITVAIVSHGGFLTRLSGCFLGCGDKYMGGKWPHLGYRLFEFEDINAAAFDLKLVEIEVHGVNVAGLDGYHERQRFTKTPENAKFEENQFRVMQKQSEKNRIDEILDIETNQKCRAVDHEAYKDRRMKASDWSC